MPLAQRLESSWPFWFGSCLTLSVVVQSLSHVQLRDPVNCSTRGSPVLHCLLEFAQISCPWSGWCYLTISSSPFSFCLHSFPASGSFPVSQLFASQYLTLIHSHQIRSSMWTFRWTPSLPCPPTWLTPAPSHLSRDVSGCGKSSLMLRDWYGHPSLALPNIRPFKLLFSCWPVCLLSIT